MRKREENKNEEEAEPLNRGVARVPLKRVKEARKIAKKMCARHVARVPLKKVKNLQKMVHAACGTRTSEKSEGGA